MSTSDRSSWRCLDRSSSRPGVPTTTSTVASASICGSYARPPYSVTTFTSLRAAALRRSSATWMASSLVGTTTRPRGADGWPRPEVTMCCSIGMPKANVLPVPVRAWPMTSCPSSAIGKVSAWIGNAFVMPAARNAAQIGSATPKSSKAVAATVARLISACTASASPVATGTAAWVSARYSVAAGPVAMMNDSIDSFCACWSCVVVVVVVRSCVVRAFASISVLRSAGRLGRPVWLPQEAADSSGRGRSACGAFSGVPRLAKQPARPTDHAWSHVELSRGRIERGAAARITPATTAPYLATRHGGDRIPRPSRNSV